MRCGHNYIKKNIPLGAGLGGGSSDVACIINFINDKYNLNLTLDEKINIGIKYGADVPYCILRGTALSEGIGEILTPLPAVPQCHVLIAKPPVHVSTKFVYENLRANELEQHPDIDGMVAAIKEGSIQGIADRLENVLENVTVPAYPEIGTLKQIMLDCGAMNSLMSGSGPTVFGLFEKEEDARNAYHLCKKQNPANVVYLTNFFNKGN